MTLFARIFLCGLAVSVCGHVLLFEQNQTMEPVTARVFQAGLAEVQGAMKDGVVSGIIEIAGEEFVELQANLDAGTKFIAQAQTLANFCSAAAEGEAVAEATEIAKAEGVEAMKSYTIAAKNLGKLALTASIVDGGMVSGPTAALLFGGGWLVSKFANGVITDLFDQVSENVPTDDVGYLDVNGDLHDVHMSANKIYISRPMKRYSRKERIEAEKQALLEMSDSFSKIAKLPSQLEGMNAKQKKIWRESVINKMMMKTMQRDANGVETPEWTAKYHAWMANVDQLVPPEESKFAIIK